MAKRKPSAGTAGRRRRTPARRQETWLYGSHPVLAALANPARSCRRLLLTAEAARGLDQALAALPAATGRALVGRAEIERVLPPGAVHQGIALATEPLPAQALGPLVAGLGSRATVVLLDRVTDPQNVGAVLRSAAAFGAAALVLPLRHAPSETGALAKAASGALERLPVVRVVNLARALDELKAAGFYCLGLAADAETTLAAVESGPRTALVLGAEGTGLRRLTRERCDALARLPTAPGFPELNVSNAAAAALYELARRAPPPGVGE